MLLLLAKEQSDFLCNLKLTQKYNYTVGIPIQSQLSQTLTYVYFIADLLNLISFDRKIQIIKKGHFQHEAF